MANNIKADAMSDRTKVEVLAAIELVCRGYSQSQAVLILRANGANVDEPKVARLLQAGREVGWTWLDSVFSSQGHELPPTLQPSLMDSARSLASDRRDLEANLKALSPQILRRVHVCHSGGEGATQALFAARLETFSRLVAKHVQALLARAERVGVGWGHTVAALAHALDTPSIRRAAKRDLLFVPTCGEPLKPLGPAVRSDRSSTAIAALLSRVFDAKNRRLSLAGVIAVVPVDFRTNDRLRFLREYFAIISDYRLVFGPTPRGSKPLIDDLDAIITSVGSFNQDWKMYTSQISQAGGLSREDLARDFPGDIGGAIIPPLHLPRTKHAEYRDIQASWTGIRIEHYKSTAARAAAENRPGVVVAAIGANKTTIVLEAVKQGLVNELIVDHDLAGAIHARLEGSAA